LPSRDVLGEHQMHMSSDSMANARDVRLRAEVLEEASDQLRSLPYNELRYVTASSYTRIVAGRDGTKHRLLVRVQGKQPGSRAVQVTVTLPGHGPRQPELIKRFVKNSHE